MAVAGCGNGGVQRGVAPEPALSEAEGTGVWGCPPDMISTPFLARKGDRGMVERVVQQPGRGHGSDYA